jgi:ABC-type multidrug transport system permease subunit
MTWLAKVLLSYFSTAIAYGVSQALFGTMPTLWMASLFVAYAIGVFYGAGSEIHKRQLKGDAQ